MSLRERLRSRCVDLVEGVGFRLEEAQQWGEAARWYQRGVDLDELGEAFYQGLMRCHLGRARYAEGMAVFRRLRTMLEATLGVAPSVRSEVLYRELKANAPPIR